jgi:hypothetical protein
MISIVVYFIDGIARYFLHWKSTKLGISRIPAHIRSQLFNKDRLCFGREIAYSRDNVTLFISKLNAQLERC